MEVTSFGRSFLDKMTLLLDRLVVNRQYVVASQAMDSLNEEVHRLEQALDDMATRPSRVIRKPDLLEPITEQQKIIDLAG